VLAISSGPCAVQEPHAFLGSHPSLDRIPFLGSHASCVPDFITNSIVLFRPAHFTSWDRTHPACLGFITNSIVLFRPAHFTSWDRTHPARFIAGYLDFPSIRLLALLQGQSSGLLQSPAFTGLFSI
jgi:hypothetical protein